mmetsp:Transcript_36827/g.92323  ORF Transcript_36827/g.92323 Transcript_36827/m.92323 type:complete len:260 (+) Transcript_36827:1014-1793(+)
MAWGLVVELADHHKCQSEGRPLCVCGVVWPLDGVEGVVVGSLVHAQGDILVRGAPILVDRLAVEATRCQMQEHEHVCEACKHGLVGPLAHLSNVCQRHGEFGRADASGIRIFVGVDGLFLKDEGEHADERFDVRFGKSQAFLIVIGVVLLSEVADSSEGLIVPSVHLIVVLLLLQAIQFCLRDACLLSRLGGIPLEVSLHFALSLIPLHFPPFLECDFMHVPVMVEEGERIAQSRRVGVCRLEGDPILLIPHVEVVLLL